MSVARVLPASAILGLVVLLGVGVWLLSTTPGSLVTEEPARFGAPPPVEADFVTVRVEQGDSARAIGEKLEQAGVIESARLFQVLTALMGLGDELEAGGYEFERGETTVAVIRRISQGITMPIVFTVTIQEGLRVEEIGEKLEEAGVISAGGFLGALDDVYTASFLEELPAGVGLEGFLFPATYGFTRQPSAHDVVQQLLDAFDQRYREQILPRLAAADGRSLHEVVVLAAIVEREAQVPAERAIIAGVFLNRLELDIPLQTDPTVQYALGNDPASVLQYGYWKRELTTADLAVDSPYNTYQHPGLPPGPIANPGLDSILAALEPDDTDYFYFVARPEGCHAFAKTLEEHNRNVSETDPSRLEC